MDDFHKTIRTAIAAVAALSLTALVGYISMAMAEPWVMVAMAIVPSLVSTMMENLEDEPKNTHNKHHD